MVRQPALLILLGLALIHSVVSLDSYFGEEDVNRVRELVTPHVRGGDLKKVHYAVDSLNLLQSPPNSANTCKDVSNSLKHSKKLEEIYHGVSVLSILKCDISLTTDQQKIVQNALGNDVLSDIYFASQIVAALPDKRAYHLDTVIERVVALQDDEGGFRSGAEKDDASAVNAGLAYEIVGSVLKSHPALATSNKDSINAVFEGVDGLLALGTSEDNGALDFTQNSQLDGLAALSHVLRGINALASFRSELDVSEAHFTQFAEYLVKSKYVHDVEGAYHLLHGLHVVADNPIFVPLVITVADSDPTKLAVRVTDVLGHVISCSVTLEQANKGSHVAVRDNAFKAQGNLHVLENGQRAWHNAPAGLYTVRFSVHPKADERYKSQTTTRYVKVLATVKSLTLEASVTDSAKPSNDFAQRVNHPGSLKPLSADQDKYLHARLTLSASGDLTPSQVFLQLVKGDRTAVFVPQASGGTYTFKLNFASSELLESIDGSGDYDIRVIVGDAALATATTWNAGKLALTVHSNVTHKDHFAVPPEIDHKFQTAEEHGASIFSLAFTALVLAPLLVLFVGLGGTGFHFDLPTHPTEYLVTLLFLAGLACILMLNLAYWLYLNIFQALVFLAVLSFPTIFVGNKALQLRYKRRTGDKEHTN